jgi:two-component system phosphate regulon sensor histidine kinase PhoR
MWPAIALAAASLSALLVWLGFLDRRRSRRERAQLRESITQLSEQTHDLSAGEKSRQQTLFDGMADGVLVVNEAGRIEFLNLALLRLLALPKSACGRPLSEALARPELDGMFRRLSTEGQLSGIELDLTRSVGRVLQVNASGFDGLGGGQHGFIFVFHDITRIKRFEDTRRDFVANVSHELRTPLNLIKGFVELLLGEAKVAPPDATRYLQTIARHTDRLTFLIEDLLTISRLESAEAAMNLQPIQLRDVAQRVLDDLQPRATECRATMENHIPSALHARADADRLEQVFFNLVENALNHGVHGGGRITLDARLLPDERVEVCVRDNGPGIPLESRDRVFERFYRVDRARSRDTGGTGLGLSIVKHIVSAHGGEVWVQSEPGNGCSFFFTLAAV